MLTRKVGAVTVRTLIAGVAVLALPSCGGGDDGSQPSAQTAPDVSASPSGEPTPDETPVVDRPGVPAESVFTTDPKGYVYQRLPAAERQAKRQMEQLFESGPTPDFDLHSVAVRRVVKSDRSPAGSVIVVSVDLEDESTVPYFQERLLAGFGDNVQETELAGRPAFLTKSTTGMEQDVIIFFHEDTVAVQVFGLTLTTAQAIAEGIAAGL